MKKYHWTDEEEKNLLKLKKEKKTQREMSEILGRSMGSISAKLNHLENGGRKKGDRKWSLQERKKLHGMRESGMLCKDIAKRLNRSPNSVYGMLREIRENPSRLLYENQPSTEKRAYTTWTDEEIEKMINLKMQDESNVEVAEKLGKSAKGVALRWAVEKERIMKEKLENEEVECPVCEEKKNIGITHTFINWKIVTVFYCNNCLHEFDREKVLEPMWV